MYVYIGLCTDLLLRGERRQQDFTVERIGGTITGPHVNANDRITVRPT